MKRLVELCGLANREYQRDGRGTMGKLAPHLEAVVVSNETYKFVSRRRRNSSSRRLISPRPRRASIRRAPASLTSGWTLLMDQIDVARSLVKVYLPYIQDLVYTFHCRNIRALYARLSAADARKHPFAPEKIDWRDYWMNVHVPGLREHIFPQLDLHTRGRVRAARRHRNLIEYARRPRPANMARAPRWWRAIISRASKPRSAYREMRDRACARRADARQPRRAAGRSRAADRRELARLGGGVLLDPLRRRGRGAAGSDGLTRGVERDLPDRPAARRPAFRGGPSPALQAHRGAAG